MLMAKVFKVELLSISTMHLTTSYKTAFPVFLVLAVLVATYAKISLTSSDIYWLPLPIIPKNLII